MSRYLDFKCTIPYFLFLFYYILKYNKTKLTNCFKSLNNFVTLKETQKRILFIHIPIIAKNSFIIWINSRLIILFNFERKSVSATKVRWRTLNKQRRSFLVYFVIYMLRLKLALFMRCRFQSNNLPSRLDFVFVFRFCSINLSIIEYYGVVILLLFDASLIWYRVLNTKEA